MEQKLNFNSETVLLIYCNINTAQLLTNLHSVHSQIMNNWNLSVIFQISTSENDGSFQFTHDFYRIQL